MNKNTICLCLAIFGMVTWLSSCSSDDDNETVINFGGTPSPNAPHWQVDVNREEIFQWSVKDDVHNILNNMIVIGEVPDELCNSEHDHSHDSMGFFADEECVGMVEHTINYENKWLYLATVYEPIDVNADITVAYKDATAGITYYWPNILRYINNDVVGEITEPFKLDLSKAQTYPRSISVDVALPEGLAKNISEGDEMAIFCGDQCRGVFTPTSDRIQGVAYMVQKNENMQFRYYSSATKCVYVGKPINVALGDVVIYYATIDLQ